MQKKISENKDVLQENTFV